MGDTVARHFRRARRNRDAVVMPERPLVDLLEEMHELRLTLAADLTAAAGAAEVGAGQVARDIIEADQHELARFARVANLRLERLARRRSDEPVPAPRNWRRRVAVALPVVPVVGAMAFSAAAATGVLPLPGQSHQTPRAVAERSADSEPVTTTFRQLVDVLGSDPSASQVIAAASKLHKQLRHLLATSPNDPGQAAEIAALLQMEQSLLLRQQPPGADVVLTATRRLARLVHVATKLESPSIAPTLVPSEPPASHRSKHTSPNTSTSPAPKATVKPSPSPSADNPAPTTSPSPDTSPFPAIPDN